MLLPGTEPEERWLAMAVEPLDGERVGAVFGAVSAVGARWPARIWTRATAPAPYSAVGRPPSYLVVRRSAWLAAGGFHRRALELGGLAPVLDAVERQIDAGLLAAELDVPGRAPLGSEWRRVESQAAIIATLAEERGWDWTLRRAAAPLILRVGARWREGRRRRAIASAFALVRGASRGRRAARQG